MTSSVELLVNVTPNETRIALLDTGVLKEVHIEREAKRGLGLKSFELTLE